MIRSKGWKNRSGSWNKKKRTKPPIREILRQKALPIPRRMRIWEIMPIHGGKGDSFAAVRQMS